MSLIVSNLTDITNTNIFKLFNTSVNFDESVDIHRARILLKLPYDKFKSLIWIDENNNENGEFWNNPDTYIHCCKKFLLNIVNNDGINTNSYKYSTTLKDCGRQYVKKFGIQSLQRQLRGYLTGNTLIDFDMINAHPTILLYICKRFYGGYSWLELDKYVNNRQSYLDKHGTDKLDILKIMNSNFVSTKLNLEREFKLIQTLLYENTPKSLQFMNVFKTEKQNPRGKFLNKILCVYENMILHNALSNIPTELQKVKMFDGFMTSNNININDTIHTLNNSTNEYGIKWSVKEPDTSIEGQLTDIDIDDKEILNYENVKTKLEKDHFMIEHPLLFGKEYTLNKVKKYSLVNSTDFSILTRPFIYEDIENGKLVKKSILTRWLSDDSKRSYKCLDFIPSYDNHSIEIYNTFTGFDYDTTDKTYKDTPKIIKDFQNHIGLLTDYDKPSVDYINKYIAHIIQKTTTNPEVCLLFKSFQGFGKDLFINFIEKMIGVQYVFRTAETEDVFGNFNSVIKDKIILQLNELEGKSGFANKEKLKNLITETNTKINEKKVKEYTQTNYLRIIICSNNLTPVEIPFDDRRFCVFQSTQCKPKYMYFQNLVDCLKNDDAIYTLYDYYNTLDINGFEPSKERPKTTAYNDMRSDNVNQLYKYLFEIFQGDDYKNEFENNYTIHKSTQNVLVKPSILLREFTSWCSINEVRHMKMDSKLIKNLLSKIGVSQNEFKVNKRKSMYYIFDIDRLRDKLIDLGMTPIECIDLDSDEYE